MAESNNPFLFHLFCPVINTNEENNAKKNKIINYSLIKLPSISEPSKCALYHYNENKNELFLLERNYYNPQIETTKYDIDKINRSCISLFINNYSLENNCSYSCYPVDALFLFISIIYYNYANDDNNTYVTLENHLDNIFKNDQTNKKKEVVKNALYLFKKNVNNVKGRLKIVCDELLEHNQLYYKPNIKKVQNFYNYKCIMLYNHIIENKIIFTDYAQLVDTELIEKYKSNITSHPIHLINNTKLKEIDKYKKYKTHIDTYLIEFNKKHYKINGTNLRTFIWLVINGFMCLSLNDKIIPSDIRENLNKAKEENNTKKMQQNEVPIKGKKHALQSPRNQPMIDSFFKRVKKN
ncbi:ribonuclease H2 subunit B, putative [Hepatocystis sp. ex Piliocolobus tephrosceles]|nr:ribonuclease H2 subunit B, putative [Hepatocystis sp. ex Piliocolobus tephrosceles]